MPSTVAFKKAYAGLNPRQKEAVDAIDGPVMVIAGPGTGKTTVLTVRIAAILERTDTPAEGILALTFTEAAAAQLRRRLAELVGPDAYRVAIGTFHGFCNGVIRDHPEAFPALAGSEALDDPSRIALVTDLIARTDGVTLLCPPNAPDLYVRAALSAIQTLKREDVPPSRIAVIAAAQIARIENADDLRHEKGAHAGKVKGKYQEELGRAAKLAELALLYGAYENALRELHRYDYEDMVTEVARALERDETLRLTLQEQYQYLLVDEHQDTNNAQNRIVELLASFWEKPNLFVVGDSKQAIFRFQGASLENFLYFREKFRDVRLVSLDRNYRSTQSIIAAAESVRPSETPLSGRAGSAPLNVLALSDEYAERFAVADTVRGWLASGTQGHEIAVLVRENDNAAALGDILAKAGIPHETASDIDAFGDPLVAQLLHILEAVVSFGDAGALLKAIAMPVLGIDPLDQYRLSAVARESDLFTAVSGRTGLRKVDVTGPERLSDVLQRLKQWSARRAVPEALSVLEDVVRQSGILAAAVSDPSSSDRLAKLHAVYDLLRDRVTKEPDTTLESFVAHLQFMRGAGIGLPATGAAGRPGRVRIMTAHKSKGLEFDRVLIAHASDSHWGGRARRDLLPLPPEVFGREGRVAPVADADDDDERNLFYVALTRARHEVVITYAQRDDAGREQLMSRFVGDIKPELLAHPDTADLESGWASRRDLVWQERIPLTPDADDRAFLRGLFLEHPFSVTALNNYLACPWRYFYSSLLRIPEAPAFALSYGNALDRALTDFFEGIRTGRKPRMSDLLAALALHVRKSPLAERERAAALERGTRALTAWYDHSHASWHANIINQLRVPAVPLRLDDGTEFMLTGKMDRVDLNPEGVVVVDYKTGKPKSRAEIAGTTKNADGNYWRQLVFYRLLLDRYQKGKYRMRTGVLDFVEPDSRGKLHREVFEISDAAVTELEGQLKRVAGDILNLAFWNARCDDTDCDYCSLRNIVEKKRPVH
jgi:DNA helicase-2/ATP-dependent DNA helicase PcrA